MTPGGIPAAAQDDQPAPDRDRRLAATHDLLISAVQKLTSSQDWLSMLAISQRLPDYSANNCLLLMIQGAEGLVMGYRAWRRIPAQDGGHCQVRRGAKGLVILAPVVRTLSHDTDRQDETGEPADRGATLNPTGRTLVGFRVAHVFDQRALVSPPDLPDTRPRLLTGAPPARLAESLTAQITAAGYQRRDDARITPANGQTDFPARTVTLRPDLPPAHRAKTLAHELAHILLHNPDTMADDTTRAIAEIEAESVAYLVTAELGLDSTAYTFPYVSHWSAGDTNLILTTANRAITGARLLLDQLHPLTHLPTPATEPPHVPAAPVPLADDGPGLSVLDEATLPHSAHGNDRVGSGQPNLETASGGSLGRD